MLDDSIPLTTGEYDEWGNPNDKEQLEDYLILTLNKAIAKASTINETELTAAAKEGMPNIPGMDTLFN